MTRGGAWLVCCENLLDRDGGAGALQGGPGLVRGFLVDLLKHVLGRAVHQVLGLLQAQATPDEPTTEAAADESSAPADEI